MVIIRRVVSKILHQYYAHRANRKSVNGMVLMFHSVGGEKDEFNITVDQFENILKRLKEKNVVRLEEWEAQKDFVCLTFDDVPESFYYNAFPLLQQYKLPFTIFVSCSLLDTDGYITTDMLKEMADSELCTVGSHGWSHGYFYELNEKEAREDLESSKKHLTSLVGKEVGLLHSRMGRSMPAVLSINIWCQTIMNMALEQLQFPSLLHHFCPCISCHESM